MLKKLTLLILMLLLALPACAEGPLTLVITGEMAFYSGPGTQYLQSAFHNTPPQPGETATILGRVPGTDGQDWLFVRFTGHWFSQEQPVQYYLPVSAAPEFADAPLLSFTNESNALAVESARVYADPEGTNYDGYLNPNDAGVTVLDVQGTIAYIEAVNPYGIPRRGYISVRDLVQQPGVASLPAAPADTATLTATHPLSLACPPANNYAQVLPLADGTLVLQYDSIPESSPWGEALAVISPDGQVLTNTLYRTHDGMEESTIEFLLTSPEGFKVCRYVGDGLTPIYETHYAPDGTLSRTDVRRYSEGDPRPMMGTAGFTVSLGRTVYAEETGGTTIPLRVTAASGTSMQLNIPLHASVPEIVECAGMLIVPVSAEDSQQLLIFSADAALLCRLPLPEPLFLYDLQAVPLADGRIAMLHGDGIESWQSWMLDISSGTLTPGPAFTAPYNRRVHLLAADEDQLLLAISGVETQLLLTDGTSQQLAATIPGTVIHAHVDGAAATLLLTQEAAFRLERWTVQLP